MNKIGNPCLLLFFITTLKISGQRNKKEWKSPDLIRIWYCYGGWNLIMQIPALTHTYLFVRKSCYVSQRSPQLALSVIHWINCIFSIIMQILKSSSKDIILSQFNLFNRVLNEERMRIDWIKLNYSIGPVSKTRAYRAVNVLIVGSFGQD